MNAQGRNPNKVSPVVAAEQAQFQKYKNAVLAGMPYNSPEAAKAYGAALMEYNPERFGPAMQSIGLG